MSKALAQGDMGDVDIVNYALTLEYLETAFYKQAQQARALERVVKKLASSSSATRSPSTSTR